MSRPVLSVIIVSYGTRDLTLAALESVRTRRDEVTLEAVVVDNASPDDSADAVEREHPWVTLIRAPENRGFAAGANRGAKAAAGEWLLFLNPDARLTDGAMTGLLAAAGTLTRPGAVGPRIEGPRGTERSVGRYYGPWRDVVRAFALYRIFPGFRAFEDVHLRRLPTGTTPVEWVTGAALLVQEAAFREVGGFDEDYFLYVEDMDLCYRLAGQGRTNLFVPSVVVHHEGSRSPRPSSVVAEGGDAAEIFVRKTGMRYPLLLQRMLRIITLLRWWWALRMRLLVRKIRGREAGEIRDSLRLCRRSLGAALRRGRRTAAGR